MGFIFSFARGEKRENLVDGARRTFAEDRRVCLAVLCEPAVEGQ